MTDFGVRLASADDLDALSSLVARANASYHEWAGPRWEPPGPAHERSRWGERFDDPVAWNLVAVSNSVLLGCTSLTDARTEEGRGREIPGLGHLSRMFVDPEHWGRGIGSALLSRAVDEMRLRRYESAQLFTPTGNARARQFYEQRGWRLDEETRDWQGLLLVRYTLDLRAASPGPGTITFGDRLARGERRASPSSFA